MYHEGNALRITSHSRGKINSFQGALILKGFSFEVSSVFLDFDIAVSEEGKIKNLSSCQSTKINYFL